MKGAYNMKNVVKMIIAEVLSILCLWLAQYFSYAASAYLQMTYQYNFSLVILLYLMFVLFGAALCFLAISSGKTKKECLILGIIEIVLGIVLIVMMILPFLSNFYPSFIVNNMNMLLGYGTVFAGANIFCGIRNIVLSVRYSAIEKEMEKLVEEEKKAEAAEGAEEADGTEGTEQPEAAEQAETAEAREAEEKAAGPERPAETEAASEDAEKADIPEGSENTDEASEPEKAADEDENTDTEVPSEENKENL